MIEQKESEKLDKNKSLFFEIDVVKNANPSEIKE